MTPTSDVPEGSRFGVFGGTFDPIHKGHLAVAEQAAKILGLDGVLVVPAGQPPHRHTPSAGAEDRLAMARIAIEGHPLLTVSDIETRRPGPSYAIDTLRALRELHPKRSWSLLLGWDAAREFGGWKNAAEIVSLVPIAVFNRSGEPAPDRDALLAAGLPGSAALLTVESPSISADEIRAHLAAGDDVGVELPPGVLRYIAARDLYAP